MLNFNLHTTTEIVFGKDIEEQIGPRLKELGAHRILVHFGGSSARTSGLLDRVEKSLFAAVYRRTRRYRLSARALHWQSERASTLYWQSAAAR
jgi:alcohol dehydrogenase class IV